MAERDHEKKLDEADNVHYKQEELVKEDKKSNRSASQYSSQSTRRSVCACISIFLLVVGVVTLTLWLVYRPTDPRFRVVGARIYDLNMSSLTTGLPLPLPLPLLSTTMQFTILTRNPNRRVSIYYDRLTAFVSYRNQQITSQVVLPPLFHEKRSTVAMSPVLGGGAVAPVPVSLEVANGLVTDQEIGVVGLRVVLLGRVRWKAGPVKTGRYAVYVKCDVLVGFKAGFLGQLPLLASPACKVDI